MLHRIQAESVNTGGPDVPAQPALCFTYDDRVGYIHIQSHQIVIITVFGVGLFRPLFPGKAVDLLIGFGLFIPVGTCKAGMIPGKSAVFSLPSRECETGVGPDLLLLADLLVAVFRVIRHRGNGFGLVPAHAVVEHNVCYHPDISIMKGLNCLEIFFFCPVFCPDSSLLVELSEIVHVINTITDVFLRSALVSGWKPYLCDTQCGEVLCLCRTAFPPQAVVRQIPFKVLHQSFVIHQKKPPFLRIPQLLLQDFLFVNGIWER